MFNGTTIPVLEQVVGFAQARHNVLAGNIANLDTPGYRTRDLSVESFQESLRNAIEARTKPQQELTPGVRTGDASDGMQEVKDSMKSILFHDDSNVGVEHQVTEIAKNQMMHNMAVSIMSSQFRLLETVINERV